MPRPPGQSPRRFQLVREIINRSDPARLLEGRTSSWNGEEFGPFDPVNDDEYDSEVKGVERVLESASDQQEVRRRVEQLFETMLSRGACSSAKWDELAGELWRASRAEGW